MCTSLAKFFKCTQAPEEEHDQREEEQPRTCSIDDRHKDQLLAMSSLGVEPLAQRRRSSRPKQPPPPLPHAPVPTPCREQDSEGSNSYKAMERHDQILDSSCE